MQYSIFISHSSDFQDMQLVSLLCNYIEQNDTNKLVSVYLAQWHSDYGREIKEKIETNIRNSNLMIVFWTKSGSNSTFVNQEIGYGRALNKPIFPIVEEGVELKGFLKDVDYGNKINRNAANDADLTVVINNIPITIKLNVQIILENVALTSLKYLFSGNIQGL